MRKMMAVWAAGLMLGAMGMARGAAPATQASEAVRVNGLDFQVVAPEVWVVPAGKEPTAIPVGLKMTNRTDKAVTMRGVDFLLLHLKDAAGKEIPMTEEPRDASREVPPLAIEPGESANAGGIARLQAMAGKAGQWQLCGYNGGGGGWHCDGLTLGKYTLSASLDGNGGGDNGADYWNGKVTTKEVAIEITDKAAAATQGAGAAARPVDAGRMALAPVVLRVKWKEDSPPGGNPSDTVTVLEVLKNESKKKWGKTARIDHEPGQDGVPQDQPCTVYLEINEKLKGSPWALLGGGAKTGVSNIGEAAAVLSKPAQKDGLSVVVGLPQAEFAVGAPVKFTVEFKNVSKDPFTLYNAKQFWEWNVRFEDLKTKGPWEVHETFIGMRTLIPTNNPLKPGEVFTVPVELDPAKKFFEYVWMGDQDRPVAPLRQLPAGKYRLTMAVTLGASDTARELMWKYWTGKVATEPVEFEIKEKAAGQGAENGAAPVAAGGPVNQAQAMAIAEAWVVQKGENWGKVTGVSEKNGIYTMSFDTPAHENALLGPRELRVNAATGKVSWVMRE